MKNSSMPDFPMALPFSIAQYFPLPTTVQCSMGTNFPKPQLGILMTVQLGHPSSIYIYVHGCPSSSSLLQLSDLTLLQVRELILL